MKREYRQIARGRERQSWRERVERERKIQRERDGVRDKLRSCGNTGSTQAGTSFPAISLAS